MTEIVEEKEKAEKEPIKIIVVGAGDAGFLGASLISRVILNKSILSIPVFNDLNIWHHGKGYRKANRKDRWR
jgi:hypothetical protein